MSYTEHNLIEVIPNEVYWFKDTCTSERIIKIMNSLPENERYLSVLSNIDRSIWTRNVSDERVDFLLKTFGNAKNLIGIPDEFFFEYDNH